MPISDLNPWKDEEDKGLSGDRGRGGSEIQELREEVNELFEDFLKRPFGLHPFSEEGTLARTFTPRMDVSETEKEFSITAELPGMDSDII